MCYLKMYINVYLMHKTNHAQLVNRQRMDRIKIRNGDKIQNGRDRKFCLVIHHLANGILGVSGCFVVIIGTAAVSIASAKSRNAYCFSG